MSGMLASIRSSELSEYYKDMNPDENQEEKTVEENVDQVFRAIGGCGCF